MKMLEMPSHHICAIPSQTCFCCTNKSKHSERQINTLFGTWFWSHSQGWCRNMLGRHSVGVLYVARFNQVKYRETSIQRMLYSMPWNFKTHSSMSTEGDWHCHAKCKLWNFRNSIYLFVWLKILILLEIRTCKLHSFGVYPRTKCVSNE